MCKYKTKPNITLIFNQHVLFQRAFWKKTLSPSAPAIASSFQRHTHKLTALSPVMMFLRKFSFPFAVPRSSSQISTRFCFFVSQQSQHKFCTTTTHRKFSSANLMA